MQRLDILTQRITGPFFPDEKLRFRRPCAVKYVVTASLSQSVQRVAAVRVSHIIIAVPSLGLQSPPLHCNDSYLVKFERAGNFSIECLNVPGMAQTVSVGESASSSELESDSLEAASRDKFCTSNSSATNLRQCQFVWAKRPRNRRRNALLQKLTAVKKDSFEMPQSVKTNSLCSSADAIESAIVNDDLRPKRFSNAPRDENAQITTVVSESIARPAERAPYSGCTVIEKVTFTGLGSEETVRILLNLKRKYEPTKQNTGTTIRSFQSIFEFRESVSKLAQKELLELFLPKGHSTRRLRRTNERMEARFQRPSLC